MIRPTHGGNLDWAVSFANPNYTEFREIIAHKHQLTPEWIMPSNGAAELLTWIAWEAHSYQGVLLPAPCFADYKRALKAFQVNFVSYSLEALATAFDLPDKRKSYRDTRHR